MRQGDLPFKANLLHVTAYGVRFRLQDPADTDDVLWTCLTCKALLSTEKLSPHGYHHQQTETRH